MADQLNGVASGAWLIEVSHLIDKCPVHASSAAALAGDAVFWRMPFIREK